MRFLVVGAGSTGGYFGGRLAQAGRDVTFLVRPARAEQLRRDGLQIISPHGDAKITPELVSADNIGSVYDVVLLSVKAFALAAAMEDMAPAVGPETLILPVLNGMKHVEILRARFAAATLAGCVCRIAASIDGQGRVVQFTGMHDLHYGEMDGSRSERLIRLDRAMRGAGFDAVLSDTILQEMWEKWVMLATLGGINCLMRGSVGDVHAVAGGGAFMLQFLGEVASVVGAVGVAPRESFLAGARNILNHPGSMMTSSMYRDLLGGHRTEADQIIGDLIARARSAAIETPLLSTAYTNLAVYESRLAAGT